MLGYGEVLSDGLLQGDIYLSGTRSDKTLSLCFIVSRGMRVDIDAGNRQQLYLYVSVSCRGVLGYPAARPKKFLFVLTVYLYSIHLRGTWGNSHMRLDQLEAWCQLTARKRLKAALCIEYQREPEETVRTVARLVG